MREVKMYECEHCGKKRLKTKRLMVKHEDVCYCNPKNKACITCHYYDNSFYACKYDNSTLGDVSVNEDGEAEIDNVKLKYKCSNWKQK